MDRDGGRRALYFLFSLPEEQTKMGRCSKKKKKKKRESFLPFHSLLLVYPSSSYKKGVNSRQQIDLLLMAPCSKIINDNGVPGREKKTPSSTSSAIGAGTGRNNLLILTATVGLDRPSRGEPNRKKK